MYAVFGVFGVVDAGVVGKTLTARVLVLVLVGIVVIKTGEISDRWDQYCEVRIASTTTICQLIC